MSKSSITCCIDCKDRFRNVYDDGTVSDCHTDCKIYNEQLKACREANAEKRKEKMQKRYYNTKYRKSAFYSKLGTIEERLER